MTTSQHIRDMRYGRQGGRIVSFEGRPSLEGKPCAVCSQPMLAGQRDQHHMCDPDSIVGRICTCPPECTDSHYGNGPRDCDPSCDVCRGLAEQEYVKR